MTLAQVIELFLNKTPGVGGVLTSDSQRLLSYGRCIGQWQGDKILMPDMDVFYSRTTSRHRGMLRTMASLRNVSILEYGEQIGVSYGSKHKGGR